MSRSVKAKVHKEGGATRRGTYGKRDCHKVQWGRGTCVKGTREKSKSESTRQLSRAIKKS